MTESITSSLPTQSATPISDLQLLEAFVSFLNSYRFRMDNIDASKVTVSNCREAIGLFKWEYIDQERSE